LGGPAMVKKTLLIVALIIVLFSLFGCQTAQGLKGDASYIGDKTAEIIDKQE
jgi:predicted small secreted protein